MRGKLGSNGKVKPEISMGKNLGHIVVKNEGRTGWPVVEQV